MRAVFVIWHNHMWDEASEDRVKMLKIVQARMLCLVVVNCLRYVKLIGGHMRIKKKKEESRWKQLLSLKGLRTVRRFTTLLISI